MSTKDTTKKHIWQELAKIKIGQTASYTDLACMMGKPKATRSVSSLLKENPSFIAVPCHRVIKKDGLYGDYVLGRDFKEYLIKWEKKILSG